MAEDLYYELLSDTSEGEVATIRILFRGVEIVLIGDTKDIDGGLLVYGAHIRLVPPDTRMLSRRTMEIIVGRIMEDAGYDWIIIQGAARTTGARKGFAPREFRFTRGGGS